MSNFTGPSYQISRDPRINYHGTLKSIFTGPSSNFTGPSYQFSRDPHIKFHGTLISNFTGPSSNFTGPSYQISRNPHIKFHGNPSIRSRDDKCGQTDGHEEGNMHFATMRAGLKTICAICCTWPYHWCANCLLFATHLPANRTAHKLTNLKHSKAV